MTRGERAGESSTAVDPRLQRLEDREEIRELTARYCFALADGDLDAVVDLFSPDGVFEGERGRFEGSHSLRTMYSRVVTPPTNKAFVHNHVIEVEGETATCRCAVEVSLVSDGEAYLSAGYYQDELRRLDGRWRFQRRRHTSFYRVPLSEGRA